MLSGSAFQAIGPATEKARRPNCVRRWRGTSSWLLLAERRLTCLVLFRRYEILRSYCRPVGLMKPIRQVLGLVEVNPSVGFRWLGSSTAVEKEGQGGKLPRVPQCRRGPAIPRGWGSLQGGSVSNRSTPGPRLALNGPGEFRSFRWPLVELAVEQFGLQ